MSVSLKKKKKAKSLMFQMYIICFVPGNNWFYLFEVAFALLIIKDSVKNCSLICTIPQIIPEGSSA